MLAIVSEYKRLDRQVGFQVGCRRLGLCFCAEFPYLYPVAASFREVHGLYPTARIESFRPFEKDRRVLRIGEGSNLDSERAHVGGSALETYYTKFYLVRAIADHAEGLSSGEREIENARFGEGTPVVDPDRDLAT